MDAVFDEEGEVKRGPGPCGGATTAIYFKPNPRRRQPDQPNELVYPSCAIHDTKRRQKAAEEQGFARIVVREEA